jgi:hypothetical protein
MDYRMTLMSTLVPAGVNPQSHTYQEGCYMSLESIAYAAGRENGDLKGTNNDVDDDDPDMQLENDGYDITLEFKAMTWWVTSRRRRGI